ncbi:RNA polymerase sigma factor [Hamadaea tsunoensis]|uniref:RNA polymerase sigma factor n=1 Tax=Hamadaea tsunoensis TaxID=53368 RepID=UPI0003F76F25|nr:RNA polymerase sigma factor [Hamadaea tsunoensis]
MADEWDERLGAARAGDEGAFRSVYRALAPSLQRYATTLAGPDGEDVASEAWLQIIRDLGAFRGGWTDFRRWAATVVRHRALDHLRQHRRRNAYAVAPEELAGLLDPADPAQAVVDRAGTYAALRLIATLPRDQAEAVILRVVLDFDARTTGSIMAKREGTVRVLVHRGLKALEKRLVTVAARSALEEVR